MQRIAFVLLLSGISVLYAQQDALTLLGSGERDLAAGDYQRAKQEISEAVDNVNGGVPDPAVLRQVVLRGAEVDALMADFGEAERLAVVLKDRIKELSKEQEARVQIVLAECAVARDDLKTADTAAKAAQNGAQNAGSELKANAAAELAYVLLLEGDFVRARSAADTVRQNSSGRLSSPDLSPRALLVPSEVDFASGNLRDARSSAEAALAARPENHPIALMLRELLARIAIEEGLPDAANLLTGLTRTARSKFGPSHPFVAQCMLTEAAYDVHRGSWANARGVLDNVARFASLPRMLRFRLLLYRANLALALNQTEQAAAYVEEARPLAGDRPQEGAAVLDAQAAVAIAQQRNGDAERMLRDAEGKLAAMTDERQPVRMSVQFHLGILYDRSGDSVRADDHLDRWSELRPDDATDEPEAAALRILANNAGREKRFGIAAGNIRRLIDIRTALSGSSAPELGEDYKELGDAFRNAEKPDDAVAAYQNALEIKQRQGGPNTVDLGLYEPLSETLVVLNRTRDAMPYFDLRLQRMRELNGAGTEEFLKLEDRMAKMYLETGQFAATESLLLDLYSAGQSGRGPAARDKSEILERLGETEARLNHFSRAAAYYEELARIDLLKGAEKLPDAEKFATRAQETAQNTKGTADLPAALNLLADVRLAAGKVDDARALYIQASTDDGATGQTKAISLNGQGEIALRNKDWTTADHLLGQAMEALGQDGTQRPGLRALIVANRAHAQDLNSHPDEASTLYMQFLDLEPLSNPPDDPPLLDQLKEFVRFYSTQPGHEQQVLEADNREIALSKRVFGEQSEDYAWALYNTAEAYKQFKRYDEAVSRYEDSLHVFEQTLGPQSEQALQVISSMAGAYTAEGKTREAIQLIEPLRPPSPDLSNSTQVELLFQLADMYRKTEDPGKAIAIYQTLRDKSAGQSPASGNSTWSRAIMNLVEATVEKGDSKGAAAMVKAASETLRRSAGNKDSIQQVQLLQVFAEALRKSGRPADKKLADQQMEKAVQMQKRLGS